MKENRNDSQYGQPSSGQQQTRSNPSPSNEVRQRSGEYTSSDEMDDIDDDDIVSRVDEDDDDILDDDDDSLTNQRGRQDSGFDSGNMQNR